MRVQLFELTDNNKLELSVDIMALVPAFRLLWERDKSEKKSQAYDDLTFAFWMGDIKSPYLSLSFKDRQKDVIEDLISNKSYKPDAEVIDAIRKYESIQETMLIKNVKAVSEAANELRSFFNNPNILKEKDKAGKPIYKPKDITSAIQEFVKVQESLMGWLKKIKEEESLSGEQIRGGGAAGDFETPDKATWLKEYE